MSTPLPVRFALVALALVAACLSAGAVPLYRITPIPDLDMYGGSAVALNESGAVAGWSGVGAVTAEAYLWRSGQTGRLGVPVPFSSSRAAAINDTGTVVGTASSVDGRYTRAVIFDGGTHQVLGTLGGTSSLGTAVNNRGHVTGSAQTVGDAHRHAFTYSDGVMTGLGALYGHTSQGYDINDAGQVVGVFYVGGAGSAGFLYDGASMHDLGGFGVRAAAAINERGEITGNRYDNMAFILAGGAVQSLGALGGSTSYGLDINDAGAVVGSAAVTGDAAMHAFLYDDGSMVDLNSRLAPDTPGGWVLSVATGINERGQIVGNGVFNGVPQAFLLTPIPEPSSLALFLAAAFVAGGQRWRWAAGLGQPSER